MITTLGSSGWGCWKRCSELQPLDTGGKTKSLNGKGKMCILVCRIYTYVTYVTLYCTLRLPGSRPKDGQLHQWSCAGEYQEPCPGSRA